MVITETPQPNDVIGVINVRNANRIHRNLPKGGRCLAILRPEFEGHIPVYDLRLHTSAIEKK